MNSERDGFNTSDNTQLSKPKQALQSLPYDEAQVDRLQSIAPARSAPSLADYINAAISSNTRRAYRDDLADFERYGGSIPCSPETLAQYIAFRATGCSPYTVARRVVGICRAHRSLGFSDPSKNELVRTVLRGVRRTKLARQRQATPLLPENVFAMLPLMTGIKGARDKAVITVAFAAALRRSEVVALSVEDLSFQKEGVVVRLRSSKSDQEGKGRLVAVPFGRTGACPVRAIKRWMELAQIDAGPLFREVRRNGAIGATPLTGQSVSQIVKDRVASVGLPAASYSGHSLRAGLVTSAARAGAGAPAIMRQTGHRSMEMLTRYIRNATLFDDNAAALLL